MGYIIKQGHFNLTTIKTKMQHLFFHIVLFVLLFKSVLADAVVPVLPEDFHGINTENYVASLTEDENFVPSMAQTGAIMFELGRYFNDKYQNNEIFDEDYEDILVEDLRQFLPNENTEELRQRLSMLRNSVRIYRSGKQLYGEYLAQKIVPPAYKKVRSAEDFDHEGEFSYIEAPENEFTKIYNFKKFLSYSDDIQEREAIRKYEEEANKELSWIDKIDYMYQKFEWKKFPAYGTSEKNPLLSDLGIGKWQKGKNADARLLSPEIYVDNKEKINVGINITTRLGYFVLANNLSKVYHKPLINLDKSKNIKSYKVLYPIALQNNIKSFAHKYFGDFVIPLELEIENPSEDVIINADMNLIACNASMNCGEEKFDLSLDLEANGKEFLPNGFENFFNMAMQTVPQETSPEFYLNKLVVDSDTDGQSLRAEFKTDKKVRNFKVFVEQIDGFSKFESPLISVRDGTIYARLKQINDADATDLDGKQFIISAELNGKTSIRNIKTAHKSTLFDLERKTLSLGIVLLAFLGGLILNFMPCVFPILALKIMALSRTPARKRKNLKNAVKSNILGIWSGFLLLIIFLCVSKYIGNSLGWGMQFQNMGFLVAMTFIVAAFIIVLPFLNFDNFYRHTINVPAKSLNYGIGFLTVMLATPCTGPYMATAVGFALTGTYADIIIILSALALGLSTPYILILCLNKPDEFFPKSGDWLKFMPPLMSLLLFMTLAWLISLIWRQTNWHIPALLGASVILFMFCFKFYLRILDYLGKIIDEQISEQTLKRAKMTASVVMTLIFAFLLAVNIFYAQKVYLEQKSAGISSRLTEIDKDLIAEKLSEGKSVLLEIKADWCLTCQYNQAMVLTPLNLKNWQKNYNLELMTVDWTDYDREVLDFMEKYGRKGLPFYVLFTPVLRDGIVLPELFSEEDITSMLINMNQI